MLTIFRKENKGIFYFIEYRIGNLVTEDEASEETDNQVILVTSRVERSQEEI